MINWTNVSLQDVLKISDGEGKATTKFVTEFQEDFSTHMLLQEHMYTRVCFSDPFYGMRLCINERSPMIIRLLSVKILFQLLRTTISGAKNSPRPLLPFTHRIGMDKPE